MFERLEELPPDPILGLGQAFLADPNPDKVGLSVGVFQDEQGRTPILASVRQAEAAVIADAQTKAYIAQAGDEGFLQGARQLLLGEQLSLRAGDRVALVQAPGGCGAVRIAAEVAKRAQPAARIWISAPTWENHEPLLSAAGFELVTYPYYDPATARLNFDAMCAALRGARAGDLVLLHASCHNPTGADLTYAQWEEVIELMLEQALVPFIDSAYQGFAAGIDEDAYGIRRAIERLPNVVVAMSCSKNFGLYRERTGAMAFAGATPGEARAARSQALNLARRSYTMAPYHGAAIVGRILEDSALRSQWQDEVRQMRERIAHNRQALVRALAEFHAARDFSFIARQHGMFSLLGLSAVQVQRLREEFGIYVLTSSRMNAAGLRSEKIAYVAQALAHICRS